MPHASLNTHHNVVLRDLECWLLAAARRIEYVEAQLDAQNETDQNGLPSTLYTKNTKKITHKCHFWRGAPVALQLSIDISVATREQQELIMQPAS